MNLSVRGTRNFEVPALLAGTSKFLSHEVEYPSRAVIKARQR